MRPLNVLIGCEFSGIVREEFRKLGHYAWSCDLLPCEHSEGGHHFEGDVRDFINATCPETGEPWDIGIFFPPCTYLCNSGVRWLYGGKGKMRDVSRWGALQAGAKFFRALLECGIPRIAVENPIMHKYAREIVGRGPDQIVQPWQFGHGETKATGLWLRNLPLLKPTRIVEGRKPRVHFASPGPERWRERSRTYTGIAAAMARQWGGDARKITYT